MGFAVLELPGADHGNALGRADDIVRWALDRLPPARGESSRSGLVGWTSAYKRRSERSLRTPRQRLVAGCSVLTLPELIDRIDPGDFAALNAEDGRDWIAGLGASIDSLATTWDLEPTGEDIWHGYHSLVVPVTGPAGPAVLKLVWPPSLVAGEAAALRAWQGRGAVFLHEADHQRGAMLLERLDPTRTLGVLPLAEAAAEAGSLLRELSIDAPADKPSLVDAAEAMSEAIAQRELLLALPEHRAWAGIARALLRELAADVGNTLVHTDLHYGNVLAGTRRAWTAIDPKPLAGDPERAVAEMLWTRADEMEDDAAVRHILDVIVDAGGLDRDKAVGWAFSATLHYWLWALELEFTVDPGRCERVARALRSLLPA